MLFEEAVVLAETVKRNQVWRLVSVEHAGGETYYVRGKHLPSGVEYTFEDDRTWEAVEEATRRAMLSL